MKKSNIFCLYHIKVKKEILSLNPWKREWKLRIKIVFTGSKLSTCFQVRIKQRIEISGNGSENYIWETARRISERVKDHTGKDVHSYLFKHAVESGHELLDVTNYSIITKGHGDNIRKRKIAEALLIKEIKPTLNRQDQSIALKLFN